MLISQSPADIDEGEIEFNASFGVCRTIDDELLSHPLDDSLYLVSFIFEASRTCFKLSMPYVFQKNGALGSQGSVCKVQISALRSTKRLQLNSSPILIKDTAPPPKIMI